MPDTSAPLVASADGVDLAARVLELISLYGEYQGALANDAKVRRDPSTAGGRATAQAQEKFLDGLKAVSSSHPLAAGVLATTLRNVNSPGDVSSGQNGAEGGPAGSGSIAPGLVDQDVYAATQEYLDQAATALTFANSDYPADQLQAALAGPLTSFNASLGLSLDDTPEMRAAVWAYYTRSRSTMAALRMETLLDAVRADIVESASSLGTSAAIAKARFAVTVFKSYVSASNARFFIEAALRQKAEDALTPYDVTAAVLDLIGLLVPPVGFIGGAISLYSLYGHGVVEVENLAPKPRRGSKPY